MSEIVSPQTILFEPWNLGDVIIAAAAARELSYPVALACNPKWQKILRTAVSKEQMLQLLPVDLPYTTRRRSHALEFPTHEQNVATMASTALVLSIRGDPRDYFVARKLFPNARIRMTGWARFLARKSSIIDLPYAHAWLPIKNRYESWAELVGLQFQQIVSTYFQRQAASPRNGRVILHLGAQWRSKQFPHVNELRDLLQANGYQVVLVASLSDSLPPDVTTESVVRAEDEDLITRLKSAEHVITNDSGPMHLSAFLGCRTTVIVRASSIEEWAPPAIRIVAAEQTPRGYRQRKHYMSDQALPNWPSAQQIAESLGPKQSQSALP